MRNPPAAPTPATSADVAAWLRAEYGWHHVEDRVTDLGWAFSVNTQSDACLDSGDIADAHFGAGPVIVVKRTRGVWLLGSNPVELPAAEAADEAAFYAARRAVFRADDPSKPHRVLPPAPRR